jgi:hypothetical protein
MGAKLIAAKVDQLTRNAAFLNRILESSVEVLFCDLPQIEGPAGKFLLQQSASWSRIVRRSVTSWAISGRTPAASVPVLSQAKYGWAPPGEYSQNTLLGLADLVRADSLRRHQEKARIVAADTKPKADGPGVLSGLNADRIKFA